LSAARHLVLCRHAHADPGPDDRSRTLSAAGAQQTQRCAAWLAEQKLPALTVLYSPAARTQQTAQALLTSIKVSGQVQVDSIYEASVSQLLQVLESHAGDLMLVGHNPGLESLLAFLCTGQSGLFRGMSPGAIAHLQLPETDIVPGNARLQALFSP
jgi:phosphohistidine phosphatase